jgi:hypothetical protein
MRTKIAQRERKEINHVPISRVAAEERDKRMRKGWKRTEYGVFRRERARLQDTPRTKREREEGNKDKICLK